MTTPRGTVWDGVLVALVLFAIIAFAFALLIRWAIRKDARRFTEDEEAEAHRRVLQGARRADKAQYNHADTRAMSHDRWEV